MIQTCTKIVDNSEAIYNGYMIILDRKIRLYHDTEYLADFDHTPQHERFA